MTDNGEMSLQMPPAQTKHRIFFDNFHGVFPEMKTRLGTGVFQINTGDSPDQLVGKDTFGFVGLTELEPSTGKKGNKYERNGYPDHSF